MKQIIGKILIYLSILVIYINIASVLSEDKGIEGQVKLQVVYQETPEVVDEVQWIVSSGMFLIVIVILLERSKNKTK